MFAGEYLCKSSLDIFYFFMRKASIAYADSLQDFLLVLFLVFTLNI